MSAFEDRLWKHLATEHGADEVTSRRGAAAGGRWGWTRHARRPPLAITAGALAVIAAAAVAVVLLVSATAGTQPAYALTQNPDGSITVTFNDLQTAIPQLNARFAAMGVDETVIPITKGCPTKMTVPAYPQADNGDTLTFTPNEGHDYLAPGFDGVLAAGYSSSGQLLVFIGALQPPLPNCLPPTQALLPPSGS
jgi:hypothetical protein